MYIKTKKHKFITNIFTSINLKKKLKTIVTDRVIIIILVLVVVEDRTYKSSN